MDLAAHSEYFSGLFKGGFANASCNLQRLQVLFDVQQEQLHAMVGALYRGSIDLCPLNVEVILRTADYLGMPCLAEACQDYIALRLVEHCPLKV